MNNWHKAPPPQMQSLKVAVVSEEKGSRVCGQPVCGCRKSSSRYCLCPSVPTVRGQTHVWSVDNRLSSAALCPCQKTHRSPCQPQTASQAQWREDFCFFLKATSFGALGVQKNLLLALKNLSTLSDPSVSASILACPKAISGLKHVSWPRTHFPPVDRQYGTVPFV